MKIDKLEQISKAIVELKWNDITSLNNKALENAGLRQKVKIMVGGARSPRSMPTRSGLMATVLMPYLWSIWLEIW